MRKMLLSFLPFVLLAFLLFLVTKKASSQVPVPAFGPETFGTEKVLPAGWIVIDDKNDNNTWEIINTIYPSIDYSSPDASGYSHIKIDASATRYEYLQSPPINFSSFSHGVLKFGLWRIRGYNEALYVSIDIGNDGSYEIKKAINPSDMPPEEKWGLISIDLGSSIDHKPVISLRFSQSNAYNNSGPLRIDDITLYGYTATLPTDHFRTRSSGNWNNTAVWESSRDNVYWIPATLTPTSAANTITIQNSHSVANTTTLSVDQLTVSNGGTLLLAHDLVLNDGAGDDLTVEEGATLDLSTYRITTSGSIQLDGHLQTANPEGLKGSSFTSIAPEVSLNTPGPTSVIEYHADGDQSISPELLYVNLAISGNGHKKLKGPVSVSNQLQINGGYLVLDDYNLVVNNSVTVSPTSYIKLTGAGKLTINNINTEPKVFPIGNNSFNPVTISNGSGLNWTVGVVDDWVVSDQGLEANNKKAVLRTWSIVPTVNPPSEVAKVSLAYNDGDPTQIGTDFNKEADVQIWREAEEGWLVVGVTQKPDVANGLKKAVFATNARFSLFAISNLDTPLPVRFRDVRALQLQSAVAIYFTNETEEAIVDYTLERSDDGQTYKPLLRIKPQQNNGLSASYETKDTAPLDGYNLYRIRASEQNGRITYSPIVRLNSKDKEPRLTVAPNPAKKRAISLQLSNVAEGNYRLNLYNAKGQLLQRQGLYHRGGCASYPLSIESLQSGTYILELSGNAKLLQQFVIL